RGPATFPARRSSDLRFAAALERSVEELSVLGEHPVALLAGHLTRTDQPLQVQLADRGMLLDLLVHDGLGVGGLVAFVVAPTAVADRKSTRLNSSHVK